MSVVDPNGVILVPGGELMKKRLLKATKLLIPMRARNAKFAISARL